MISNAPRATIAIDTRPTLEIFYIHLLVTRPPLLQMVRGVLYNCVAGPGVVFKSMYVTNMFV